jgi:hypothetical protein
LRRIICVRPADIVMSVTEIVDAALAGLDMGELATIPSPPQRIAQRRRGGAGTAVDQLTVVGTL